MTLCVRVISLFVILFSMPLPVWAQGATAVVPETCDAEFHDVIRTKAWMEAQREFEVAQTLILDQEKVLDLSCFGNSLDQTASINSFANDLEGTIDQVLDGIAFNDNCEYMADVWEFQRCQNVDKDKFFPSFENLVTADQRPSCSGSAHLAERNSNWNSAKTKYLDVVARPLAEGGLDSLDLLYEQMDIEDCSASAKIETGVIFEGVRFVAQDVDGGEGEEAEISDEGEEFEIIDTVCLAPGCYFNGSDCVKIGPVAAAPGP